MIDYLPASVREFPRRRAAEIAGLGALAGVGCLGIALLTWSVSDPSLNHATNAPVHNLMGVPGAAVADILMQMLGLACVAALAPLAFRGWGLLIHRRLFGFEGTLSYRLLYFRNRQPRWIPRALSGL